jgi:adenosylmethionine-8-amino-7-oxononanoate aminotransferase
MIFHDDSVVRAIRKSCNRHQVLLILDEIMVGLGRLGSMTASELIGIQPDILTLSKSLTGGMLPLAATISSARIFDAFQSDDLEKCLMHGPTFTGNALACAAANASLDLFEMEPRLSQVHQIESHLLQALTVCCDFPGVVDVRVRGAIGVVQLTDLGDFYWIRRRFVEKGVWLRPFGNVVYIMPAFSIDQGDLTKVTDTMIEIIGEWSDQYVGKLG